MYKNVFGTLIITHGVVKINIFNKNKGVVQKCEYYKKQPDSVEWAVIYRKI